MTTSHRTDPAAQIADLTARLAARPASRADRMAHPTMLHAIKQVADKENVCVRPLAMRRTDLATGQTETFDLRCGATRETVCPPCARRAKRARQQQCRDGWHRDDEPLPTPEVNDDQIGLLKLRANWEYARAECLARADWEQVADLDAAITDVDRLLTSSGLRGHLPPEPTPVPPWAGTDDPSTAAASSGDPDTVSQTIDNTATDDGDGQAHTGQSGGGGSRSRRVRSTRRRQDAPDLPRHEVTARTIGRTYQAPNGKVFRPSTFITVTLPSYGRVGPDGAPLDPASYDYRRAAWDAVHFPALLDRLWQNLRRAVGFNVQYFGTVEPQRRLAPHAHFAARGAIARAIIRKVIQATYHQVWWPSTATVVYPEDGPQPTWNDDTNGYVDPDTADPLPTWQQAIDALDDQLDTDPDQAPEHVVRFGNQLDLQGVLAGTAQAEHRIRYLTKYLTKSVTDCHPPRTGTAQEHQRRLWQQLRYTPCSPRCPNWLRYGIQPKHARPKQTAGRCKGKVHALDTLGIGGRRVLVSRKWTGKTLADQRWDQVAWVRNMLAISIGRDDPIDDQVQADIDAARAGGAPAPLAWELARPSDPDVPDLGRRLLRAIATKIQHRAAIAAAKAAGPPGPVPPDISATGGADGSG
jgi:hypothetical protein